jgi:hypothetical protein
LIPEQEINDFSLPPKMLKQSVFINLRTSQQRDVDLISEELVGQNL